MLANQAVEAKMKITTVRLPAWQELSDSLLAALETYSNVHRGAGHYSQATTQLYETARTIVRAYLGCDDRWNVIFCPPRRAASLSSELSPTDFRLVSSRDLGLPLGICALAIRPGTLPAGAPPETGGGTVRLTSHHWAIWEGAPERFETGTPSIMNVIALARALQLVEKYGPDAFQPDDMPLEPEEILHQDELAAYRGPALLRAVRHALIGGGGLVPVQSGFAPFANLDNGASTPTFWPVWRAFFDTLRQPAASRRAMTAAVQSICAGFLGAPLDQYDVIFTSNTTEATNLVAHSLAAQVGGTIPVIVNTLLEHNSNELPWRFVPGARLVRHPVDEDGFIDLAALDALLSAYNREGRYGNQRVCLLAVSGGSNVLGAFNDLAAMCAIAHRYGVQVLVDAAQLVAHRRVEMLADGIDYLAFSAHKVYAPFGSGALVARKGLLCFSPAEWTAIRASGEENTAGIAALGKMLVLLGRVGMDVIEADERRLTHRTLEGMAEIPGIRVYGVHDPESARLDRRGGVIAFAFESAPHNLAAEELAQTAGIGVRTGCFCAHLLVKRLLRVHPVRARLADLFMLVLPGFTSTILPGLVRVSYGIENDDQEVERLLAAVSAIAARPRSLLNRFLGWSRNGTPFLPRGSASAEIKEFVHTVAERVYSPLPSPVDFFTEN